MDNYQLDFIVSIADENSGDDNTGAMMADIVSCWPEVCSADILASGGTLAEVAEAIENDLSGDLIIVDTNGIHDYALYTVGGNIAIRCMGNDDEHVYLEFMSHDPDLLPSLTDLVSLISGIEFQYIDWDFYSPDYE